MTTNGSSHTETTSNSSTGNPDEISSAYESTFPGGSNYTTTKIAGDGFSTSFNNTYTSHKTYNGSGFHLGTSGTVTPRGSTSTKTTNVGSSSEQKTVSSESGWEVDNDDNSYSANRDADSFDKYTENSDWDLTHTSGSSVNDAGEREKTSSSNGERNINTKFESSSGFEESSEKSGYNANGPYTIKISKNENKESTGTASAKGTLTDGEMAVTSESNLNRQFDNFSDIETDASDYYSYQSDTSEESSSEESSQSADGPPISSGSSSSTYETYTEVTRNGETFTETYPSSYSNQWSNDGSEYSGGPSGPDDGGGDPTGDGPDDSGSGDGDDNSSNLVTDPPSDGTDEENGNDTNSNNIGVNPFDPVWSGSGFNCIRCHVPPTWASNMLDSQQKGRLIQSQLDSLNSTRPLTQGERSMCYEAFGNRLKLDGIVIVNSSFNPFKSSDVVNPFGNPWFPDWAYRSDFSKASPESQGRFIHELTHSLQHQQGYRVKTNAVAVWALKQGDYQAAYPYELSDLGNPLYSFNHEQQAEIIEHYYLIRRGYRASEGPIYDMLYKKTCATLDTVGPWFPDFGASQSGAPIEIPEQGLPPNFGQ